MVETEGGCLGCALKRYVNLHSGLSFCVPAKIASGFEARRVFQKFIKKEPTAKAEPIENCDNKNQYHTQTSQS